MFRSLALKSARPTAFAMMRPAVRMSVRGPMCAPAQRFYSENAKAEATAGEANAAKAEATSGEADAAAAPAATEIEKKLSELQAKYDAKDKECAKLKEGYARQVADFQNLQKTTQREIEKAKAFALQKFAKDLIESVDNFDIAIDAVAQEKLDAGAGNKDLVDFYEGVKMVQDVFERTLAKHGLTKMDPLGEDFDANLHEATFIVPQPDKKSGSIFHVQQVGFKLNDRVLRAPKVGVVADSE